MEVVKPKNQKVNNRKPIVVICGIKNSGKTTLMTKVIQNLSNRGYKVATIKHDGHDFEPDVPGTDSYHHQKAGAYGSAVFSKHRFLITKQVSDRDEMELEKSLIEAFPEADVILIEGLKNSSYEKIEVIRSVNGNQPVSNPEGRFLIVTDKTLDYKIQCSDQEDILLVEEIDKIVDKLLFVIGKGE